MNERRVQPYVRTLMFYHATTIGLLIFFFAFQYVETSKDLRNLHAQVQKLSDLLHEPTKAAESLRDSLSAAEETTKTIAENIGQPDDFTVRSLATSINELQLRSNDLAEKTKSWDGDKGLLSKLSDATKSVEEMTASIQDLEKKTGQPGNPSLTSALESENCDANLPVIERAVCEAVLNTNRLSHAIAQINTSLGYNGETTKWDLAEQVSTLRSEIKKLSDALAGQDAEIAKLNASIASASAELGKLKGSAGCPPAVENDDKTKVDQGKSQVPGGGTPDSGANSTEQPNGDTSKEAQGKSQVLGGGNPDSGANSPEQPNGDTSKAVQGKSQVLGGGNPDSGANSPEQPNGDTSKAESTAGNEGKKPN